jgi:DNA-binding NarL/FixJ family response regulator
VSTGAAFARVCRASTADDKLFLQQVNSTLRHGKRIQVNGKRFAVVRSVGEGHALLSPGVTRRLIAEFVDRSRGTASPAVLEPLTDREREVVGLVGGGLNNEEIGARLFMSPATTKTHVSRAMIKMHARDRAQLVVIAYESGLVRPGWS